MERIGIFGGTFDPFHNGHLHALRAFVKTASIDRLILVPTFLPPHKATRQGDDPAVRLAMLHALCDAGIPHLGCPVEISDFEIARGGKSYTYDTLCHFRAEYDALTVLVGGDMFCTLEDWYRGRELFSLAAFVCVLRGDRDGEEMQMLHCAARYREAYGADVTVCKAEALPLSSTEIRTRIRAGEDPQGLVPPAIATYIKRNGLYHGN